MPLCVPHCTQGGPLKAGGNSKWFSTASWWVAVQDNGVFQLQQHKSETGVGSLVRAITLGHGGKREDMMKRRHKTSGDVNVDPFRIVMMEAPFYLCIASAMDLATIQKDFQELHFDLVESKASSPLYELVDVVDPAPNAPVCVYRLRKLDDALSDLEMCVMTRLLRWVAGQELMDACSEIDDAASRIDVVWLQEQAQFLSGLVATTLEKQEEKEPAGIKDVFKHMLPINMQLQYIRYKLDVIHFHLSQIITALKTIIGEQHQLSIVPDGKGLRSRLEAAKASQLDPPDPFLCPRPAAA